MDHLGKVKVRKNSIIIFLFLIVTIYACNTSGPQRNTTMLSEVAKSPPMGWNSFDAYDCRINEEEFRATVDYIAENLKEYGWEYVVLDYVWWHPEPGNWDNPRRFGHPNIRYNPDGSPLNPEFTRMDEYGRLIPAIERFPSSANGQGFKPLADYVHSKGLKFGLHIMRGIHRVAWFNDLPVKDTQYTAKDIAQPLDTCPWLNHMYGVNHTKPGAQEYYNSLFELYAEWGVDFIKADDMMVPPYHKGEIEMMRKAIDNAERPMVLSLSCGEAPLSRAKHLAENANMWRISADFWDDWEHLKHNFDLLNQWSSYIGPGTWPDADMLPIGRLSLNNRPHGPERLTRFTWDEQITLMSLWCIARSPLMIGADLLSSPDSTMLLLTNKEVLDVNQHSTNNRQVAQMRRGGNNVYIWLADCSLSEDKYIALFNVLDDERQICYNLNWELEEDVLWNIRDLWAQENIGQVKGTLCTRVPAHGAVLYKLSK
jgi:alpha-galactosidase